MDSIAPTPRPLASGEPATILVVDDIRQNRDVAQAYLHIAGYRVTTASSGHEALDLFAKTTPDLVLLDILMPDLDGLETCRRLRALPAGADTPIVFLTALSDVDAYRAAMDCDPDDFLTKPINRVELTLRVRSLLRIRRLNRDLQTSYETVRSQRDALEKALRQKEELSALVVHDLKNPLSAILMNAQYAVELSAVTGPVREVLEDIVTSSESLNRLVLDLLDISRSEDGALVPKLREIDVAEVVRFACASMRRRAEEKDQQIASAVRTSRPALLDRDLMARLLENLLDNAIRHSPPGSALGIEGWNDDEGAVHLAVRDQGPGIAPADRARIFEKYVRIDRDVGSRANRGLGLVFSRLAVEAHGGSIWVEDNEPRGSVFRVRFPVAASR